MYILAGKNYINEQNIENSCVFVNNFTVNVFGVFQHCNAISNVRPNVVGIAVHLETTPRSNLRSLFGNNR